MENENQRFRLIIAYDGRPFEGWQSQPGGNTVQDHILAVLNDVCPAITALHGSGRTDAGVSAHGQCAHFDAPAEWSMDSSAWLKCLNARLPHTIRIMACEETDGLFHARFSASGKVYRYRIFTGAVLPPLDHGLVLHCRNLSIDRFTDQLIVFEGTHHFRAFSANRNDGKDETLDTERTIFQIKHTEPAPGYISVEIHGSGFLYKMVRFIIGTGIYLTREKITATEVENWLKDPPSHRKAPYCAPPDGLSLVKVVY